MAEWLIERGIGEDRALLVGGGEVFAVRHVFPGEPEAGGIYPGKLTSRAAGATRGTVLADAGFEILVDRLPRDCTEGGPVNVQLTRAPIPERRRTKLAQGRIVDPASTATSEGWNPKPTPRFESGLWEDVWHAASAGCIDFAGGEIVCNVTPAMTVIDVDGDLPRASSRWQPCQQWHGPCAGSISAGRSE